MSTNIINPGTLYVVATPIGNLDDMTFRGVEVLSGVHLIAAEDTRTSRVLLDKYNVKTPLFSCHKFNEGKRGDFFVSKLMEGKSIALISDAGTPCISDPGHLLVSLAHKNGITVTSVCGASSVMAALSVSGFDGASFTFIGFLPKGGEGKKVLADLIKRGGTYVFFESPKRILKTIANIHEISDGVNICLCNDLTKKFERIYHGTAMHVLNQLTENENAEKGEYTCVINSAPQEAVNENSISIEALLVDIMAKEGIDLKEAINELKARNKGLQKKQIYNASLVLKKLLVYNKGILKP